MEQQTQYEKYDTTPELSGAASNLPSEFESSASSTPPPSSSRKRNIIYFKLEAPKPRPIVHFPKWDDDQEKPRPEAYDEDDQPPMRDMHGQDS